MGPSSAANRGLYSALGRWRIRIGHADNRLVVGFGTSPPNFGAVSRGNCYQEPPGREVDRLARGVEAITQSADDLQIAYVHTDPLAYLNFVHMVPKRVFRSDDEMQGFLAKAEAYRGGEIDMPNESQPPGLWPPSPKASRS
jgi:hypothetical protein